MNKILRSIDTYVVLSFVFCSVVFLSVVASKDFALNNTRFEPTKQLAQVASSLDNGLIAKWSFDEGSGTTASDSVGGNTGTLTGGPSWVTGKIGGALQFDGVDDYVSTNNTFNTVAGASQKTISAWVNLSNKVGYLAVVELHKTASAYAFAIRTNSTGNSWEALYRSTGDTFTQISSSIPVSLNNWQLVTLVQDGANVFLYVDGNLSASASNAVTPSIANSCY
jgi:hypothetical protein